VAQLDKSIPTAYSTRTVRDDGLQKKGHRRKRSLQEVLVDTIRFLKSLPRPDGNVLVDAAMRAGMLSSCEIFCVELRLPDVWDRVVHFPVVAAGQGAQRFFQASPWGDVRGHVFSMLVHPEDRPKLETIARLASTGGGRECEGRAGRHGGRARLRLMHFSQDCHSRQPPEEAQGCGKTMIACEYIALDFQLAAHRGAAGDAGGTLVLVAPLETAEPHMALTREIGEGEGHKFAHDKSKSMVSLADYPVLPVFGQSQRALEASSSRLLAESVKSASSNMAAMASTWSNVASASPVPSLLHRHTSKRSMTPIASSHTDESLSKTGHCESSTFSREDGGTISRDEGYGSSRSPKEDDSIEPATPGSDSWYASTTGPPCPSLPSRLCF